MYYEMYYLTNTIVYVTFLNQYHACVVNTFGGSKLQNANTQVRKHSSSQTKQCDKCWRTVSVHLGTKLDDAGDVTVRLYE